MPWTKSSPPDVAKNKPEDQIEACVLAANRTLNRGGTEEEAIFACVGAMKAVVKKSSHKPVQRQERKLPSHVPTVEMFKALREEQQQEVVKKALALPAFLSKHSLPEGVERNVIAINFDKVGKLVVAFDTGEIITTDAVAIKEIVEQHIGVSVEGGIKEIVAGVGITVDNTDPKRPVISSTGGGGTAPTGNLLYNQYALSGTHFFLNKEEHGLEFITSFYIKDKNHKEVILEVHINPTGRIDVHSLIPMTDMTLHLTGITA